MPRAKGSSKSKHGYDSQVDEDEDHTEGVKRRHRDKDDDRDTYGDENKGARRRVPPTDWDQIPLPKYSERACFQSKVDAAKCNEMNEEALAREEKRNRVSKDPSGLKRKWKMTVSITGLCNLTESSIDAFICSSSCTTKERLDPAANRLFGELDYTNMIRVPKGKTKQFKKEHTVKDKIFDLDVKEMMLKELIFDVWAISGTTFNTIVGTAITSYYTIANSSPHQTVPIVSLHGNQTVGYVSLRAFCLEQFRYDVKISNLYFKFKQELEAKHKDTELTLIIAVPKSGEGDMKKHTTSESEGPAYTWKDGGKYKYMGTHCSIQFEDVKLTVQNKTHKVGEAVFGLAACMECPGAQGTVKTLSDNTEEFTQGTIGGSIVIKRKSQLLKKGERDDHHLASIPIPRVPDHELLGYCLSDKDQYLVVVINSCDGLPIADNSLGMTNPMARVRFDGSIYQTHVIINSTNPVWNTTFRIPVRVFDEKVRTDKQHYKKLLPLEMKSKGFLEIEIWHSDDKSAVELIGTYKYDLHKLRASRKKEMSLLDLCGTGSKEGGNADGEDEREDDEKVVGNSEMKVNKCKVRYAEIRKDKFTHLYLAQTMRASVSFDCFFIPDFPEDFKYPPQDVQDDEASLFGQSFELFESQIDEFSRAYKIWFPDSTYPRHFTCKYRLSNHSMDRPLPLLVRPLALPRDMQNTREIFNWVRHIGFTVPPGLASYGFGTNWQPVDKTVMSRKGGVQDHAVLLCCAFLAMGKDAYVCKGTGPGGIDQAWVMTREDEGCVTFWETTTGACYHLPKRWTGGKEHTVRVRIEKRWDSRRCNDKWKGEPTDQREKLTRQQHLDFINDLEKIPIFPWPDLLTDDMPVLPYETIEVVFNASQLWANILNAHPSCVYYDMVDGKSWLPLITDDDAPDIVRSKGDVLPIRAAIAEKDVDQLERDILGELKECTRVARVQVGLEARFSDNYALTAQLERWLKCLNKEACLDADWAHDNKGRLARPWSCHSSQDGKNYVEAQKEGWKALWKERKLLEKKKKKLPVKTNYLLSGVPFQLMTSDMKDIRWLIMSSEPVTEYVNIKQDRVYFKIVVKVFPMPGQVNSVWIFYGCEIPIKLDQRLAATNRADYRDIDSEADSTDDEEPRSYYEVLFDESVDDDGSDKDEETVRGSIVEDSGRATE